MKIKGAVFPEILKKKTKELNSLDELVTSFIFQSRNWQIWQDYTEMNDWNRRQSHWNLKTVKNFPNSLACAEVAERIASPALGWGFATCYYLCS